MHDSERLAVLVRDLEAPACGLASQLDYLEPEDSVEGLLHRNCIRRRVTHPREVTLVHRMATFDQLAADQRAIIEIVLRQDRSYEQIGDMLDLPPARVRELARDALAELAPFTAEFVDPQWRGQLADYVLGQQTGPEAQATRGRLRRSEPARIWSYSLLDALDDFFGDGNRPEIPVGEAGGSGRARTREREARSNGEAPVVQAPPRATAAGAALSPAARDALRRRRIIGGAAGIVVIALLIFGAT